MTTTEVIRNGDAQLVRLPTGFEFAGNEVAIRREGDAVVIEPIKTSTWPPSFFDRIRIDDPAFVRPDQGSMPEPPRFESS